MTLRFAILGLLSWKPLSGYDLKKIIANSSTLYWSGNNNQIYTNLVQLRKEGLVTVEVQQQESLPARKIYSITDAGREALHTWVSSPPVIFELHNNFLIQLSWAGKLDKPEIQRLLAAYEREIEENLATEREKARRAKAPNRTPQEEYLWIMIAENQLGAYERELDWVRRVRAGLDTV